MNRCSFLSSLFHAPVPRIAIILLIALACSIPAICGEIHDAAKAGDLAKVKVLLTENPELVSSKWYGRMPLHEAAVNGHKDVVELLLAKGADVNAKDRNGNMTPLHWGVWSYKKDVVELLLANGADVKARNNNGLTPLHMAAQRGLKDIAELLLAKGAEVTASNNNGETPLHMAAQRGRKDMAELLRQHGGHE
jgi:ankyrin repeat protein